MLKQLGLVSGIVKLLGFWVIVIVAFAAISVVSVMLGVGAWSFHGGIIGWALTVISWVVIAAFWGASGYYAFRCFRKKEVLIEVKEGTVTLVATFGKITSVARPGPRILLPIFQTHFKGLGATPDPPFFFINQREADVTETDVPCKNDEATFKVEAPFFFQVADTAAFIDPQSGRIYLDEEVEVVGSDTLPKESVLFAELTALRLDAGGPSTPTPAEQAQINRWRVPLTRISRDEMVVRARTYLQDFKSQLIKFVSASVRTVVASIPFKEVTGNRQRIVQVVFNQVYREALSAGWRLNLVKVTGLTPTEEVLKSMNEIKAANNRVKVAKADAKAVDATTRALQERTRLLGDQMVASASALAPIIGDGRMAGAMATAAMQATTNIELADHLPATSIVQMGGGSGIMSEALVGSVVGTQRAQSNPPAGQSPAPQRGGGGRGQFGGPNPRASTPPTPPPSTPPAP